MNSKCLGHASVSVTWDIYAHAFPDWQEELRVQHGYRGIQGNSLTGLRADNGHRD